jgi:hypothetical protein
MQGTQLITTIHIALQKLMPRHNPMIGIDRGQDLSGAGIG